jgi:hypothetical protein
MFDPDDYELHEAQKHACKMAKERDEARVLLDRLAAELAECAEVLPVAYYMDPPDGGDVSVSEQLSRMAKDAERYRLLRRKFAIISDGDGHAEFCAINLPRPTYIAPSSAIELDAALDRERLGLDGASPPETMMKTYYSTDDENYCHETPGDVFDALDTDGRLSQAGARSVDRVERQDPLMRREPPEDTVIERALRQFEQLCRAIVRCATDALRIKPKEQP